ncbi:MAG: hypothetical protein ACYC75_00930 [Minisyncoccota bacterium]
MLRKTSFVKVSGDQFRYPEFLSWIAKLTERSYVTVCIGGGTQINKEFARRGFPVKKHGPLGRESETFEERQLARDILENNAAECEDLLAEKGIHIRVAIPVMDIGGVLCHLNGDLMIRAAYLGYDELFIITTPNQKEGKVRSFVDLPRIQVFSFE